MRDHLLDVVIDVIEEMAAGNEIEMLQEGVEKALELAGVRSSDIQKIIRWVDGFRSQKEPMHLLKSLHYGEYFRVLSFEEAQHMSLDAQSFLLALLQNQVVPLEMFENILNQIFLLKGRQVDLHHVQWISFMVVMNQSKDQTDIALFETWMMKMGEDHFDIVIH